MLFVSGLTASSSQHYIERWQPFPPSGRSHFSILSVCPILEPALQDLPANQETTHCYLRDPGCQRKDLQVVIGLLEGVGLDGVTETGAMATPALEVRAEDHCLRKIWTLFESASLRSSWASHEPWQWPRELRFALCQQLNYQVHHIYEINNQQIITSMLIKALDLCTVL